MEEKIYKVGLEKDEFEYMVFDFDDCTFKINMNEDRQDELRNLFYHIIKLSFEFNLKFELSEQALKYENSLFVEIASEYLKDLNTEIKSIMLKKTTL